VNYAPKQLTKIVENFLLLLNVEKAIFSSITRASPRGREPVGQLLEGLIQGLPKTRKRAQGLPRPSGVESPIILDQKLFDFEAEWTVWSSFSQYLETKQLLHIFTL